MSDRDIKIAMISKNLSPFLIERISFTFSENIERGLIEFKYLLFCICDADENFTHLRNVENIFKTYSNNQLRKRLSEIVIAEEFTETIADLMNKITECEREMHLIDNKKVCNFLKNSLPLIYDPENFLKTIQEDEHFFIKINRIMDMYLAPFNTYGEDFLKICKKYVIAKLADNEFYIYQEELLSIFKKQYKSDKDYKEKKKSLLELLEKCVNNIQELF